MAKTRGQNLVPLYQSIFPCSFSIEISKFQQTLWVREIETHPKKEEAMEGEKPTTLVCTVLAINHTNLCYRACAVCERTLPDNDPTSLCKFCNFNAFNSVSSASKRLFRVLVSHFPNQFPLCFHWNYFLQKISFYFVEMGFQENCVCFYRIKYIDVMLSWKYFQFLEMGFQEFPFFNNKCWVLLDCFGRFQ